MYSVAEFAEIKGISVQRAHALAKSGLAPVRRVGSHWLFEPAAMSWEPQASRPLSERNAWALIEAISNGGVPAHSIAPMEKSRLLARLPILHESKSPAALLRSWLARRAEAHDFEVSNHSLQRLRRDKRQVPSGISDKRSQLAASSEFEAYVSVEDFDAIRHDHFLIAGEHNNVRIHVVRARPVVGVGLIAADLADWNRPREDAQASRLLAEALR